MTFIISEHLLIPFFPELLYCLLILIVLAVFARDPEIRLDAGLLIEILKTFNKRILFACLIDPVAPVILIPSIYRIALG